MVSTLGIVSLTISWRNRTHGRNTKHKTIAKINQGQSAYPYHIIRNLIRIKQRINREASIFKAIMTDNKSIRSQHNRID